MKSAGEGTELEVSQDIKRKGDDYSIKHKSELKTTCCKEWDLKFKCSNKKNELGVEWKPTDMNKDGQEVEVDFEFNEKPAQGSNAQSWGAGVELKAGGFDMGPIKPYTNLGFKTNDKQDHEITWSQNMVYEKEFHAAWNIKMDQAMAMKSAYGWLGMTGANGNYYLRANLLDQFFGLGTWFKHGDHKHSLEVQYDVKNKKPGMFGQPLYMRYGGIFKIGKVEYHNQMLVSDKIYAKDVATFNVTDNLKMNLGATYDLWGILASAEKTKVNAGVGLELKI